MVLGCRDFVGGVYVEFIYFCGLYEYMDVLDFECMVVWWGC